MKKVYSAENIRNITLAGHSGSGKTSLIEAILYNCGVTSRIGRIDEGNTVMDYNKEEIERKTTINLKMAYGEWDNILFNILDTPGYADFIGEVAAGLKVADIGLMVVDAVGGPEIGLERAVEYADQYGIPRMFVINRIKKEHASFANVLDELSQSYKVAPAIVPVGEAEGTEGVIDILSGKFYKPYDGKSVVEDIPDSAKDVYEEYKEKLMEAVAETSDELMEKYFEEGELPMEDVIPAMKKAIIEKTIIPLVATDAYFNIGVDAMLNFLKEYGPSPADMVYKAKKGEEEVEIKVNGPFAGFVFKTTYETHVGEMVMVRSYGKSIKSGVELINRRTGKVEKINQVYILQGKEREEIDELPAGGMGVFVKLKETHTNDTLTDKDLDVVFDPIQFPEPLTSVAIVPQSKGDEEKVSNALTRLSQEDPSFSYKYDSELKQTLVYGMGELHLDIMINKLKEKFNVSVDTEKPKIPYRETIKKKAEAEGKYKKQTGGRGQFGDAWIRIEPLERGKGFEFVDAIVGGVIPSKFIPSVEKGIKDAMAKGILAGYPVIDIKATVYDGKTHPVDSSDIAFQIAGSLGFKNAAEKADPVLLEPIMEVEVIVPEEFMGAVNGDLNSRRGRILGMDSKGKYQVIKAHVPMAEMYKYSSQLRSLTQGKGTFTQRFSHYEEVPREIAEKIIKEYQQQKDQEK